MTDTLRFAQDRLKNAVQDILDTIVATAALYDVELPSRQITGTGVIPYDCEMVFASSIQVGTGAPEARNGSGTYPTPGANNTMYQLTASLGIVRKTTEIPSGPHGQNPPDPSTFLANLDSASTDTSLLIEAIDTLQDQMPMDAIPRTVTTTNPQGGLVAVTARITMLV